MTVIDVFIALPFLVRFIIGALCFIWAVEVFLLPFKFNLWYNRGKEVESVLREILSETQTNKISYEDSQRILSILLGIERDKRKKKSGDE